MSLSVPNALAQPQNIDAIKDFLEPKDHAVLNNVCKAFQWHSSMERAPQAEKTAYRYPFHGVTDINQSADIFARVNFNSLYLREPDGISGYTPAFEALKNGRVVLAGLYLSYGGALATTQEEKEYIWKYRTLHTDFPIIGIHIRQIKWDMAKTDLQKKEFLEWYLEESCHKGNMKGVQWALRKAEKFHIPISIFRSLELATQSGLHEVFAEVCSRTNLSQLTNGEKERLVELCSEMRYSDLLLCMAKNGFPVTNKYLSECALFEKLKIANGDLFSLPQPASANSHTSHGGNDNLLIATAKYREMVVYAYQFLKQGGDVRKLIDNLCHRRLHMAVVGKRNSLESYGKFTSEMMVTEYGEGYREYGERIRAKYNQFPVQVNAQIGDRTIPMTVIQEGRWVHPDGRYRDVVIGEIARLCEPLRAGDQDEISKPLARITWLASHYPPCQRGTPIVLRALIDAICLIHGRYLDPRYEINCDALVYDNCEEFATAFATRAPLPKCNPEAEK